MKPQTITVYLKCADRFNFKLETENGIVLVEQQQTYVLDWFLPKHYGDGFKIEIDLETGQILNWVKPTEQQLEETIKEFTNEDEEEDK